MNFERRWFPRIRFSLRTLVLLTLLIGSAGTLWRNWEPWRESFSFETEHQEPGFPGLSKLGEEESSRLADQFSEDGRYFVAFGRKDSGSDVCTSVRVGDTKSAKITLSLVIPGVYEHLHWMDGHLLLVRNRQPFEIADSSSKLAVLIDMSSGEWRDITSHFVEQDSSFLVSRKCLQFFPRFNFDGPETGKRVIRRISDFSVIDAPSDGLLTANDRVVFLENKSIKIVNLNNGRAVATEPFHENPMICACYSYIVARIPSGSDKDNEYAQTVVAIDSESGKTTLKVMGYIRNISKNGSIIEIQNSENGPTKVYNTHTGNLIASGPERRSMGRYFFIRELEDGIVNAIHDASNGAELWRFDQNSWLKLNSDWVAHRESDNTLVEIKTGVVLQTLPPKRCMMAFAQNSRHFVLYNAEMNCNEIRDPFKNSNFFNPLPIKTRASVYELRRPWHWYGISWLPEFWLTFFLACCFGWSVVRDRRQMALNN